MIQAISSAECDGSRREKRNGIVIILLWDTKIIRQYIYFIFGSCTSLVTVYNIYQQLLLKTMTWTSPALEVLVYFMKLICVGGGRQAAVFHISIVCNLLACNTKYRSALLCDVLSISCFIYNIFRKILTCQTHG